MLKSSRILAAAGAVAGLGLAVAPLNVFADEVPASDQHTDQLVVTVLPSCTFGSYAKTTTDGARYPSGIEHNNSEGNYGSDLDTAGEKSAAIWNLDTTTAETTATGNHTVGGEGASGGEVDHIASDLDSSGYGIIPGEGGVTGSTDEKAAHIPNPSEHTVHRSMLAGTTTENFAQTKMWVVCNNRGGYSITATAADLTNGTTDEDIKVVAEGAYSKTASGYNGIVSAADKGGMTKAANVVQNAETIIATKSGVSAEAGDYVTVEYGVGIATSQKADTYAGNVVYKLYKGINGAGTAGA